MTTLVEACARALAGGSVPWNMASKQKRRQWIDQARAVIPVVLSHLREPTEAMLHAALAVPLVSIGNGQYRKPDVRDEWQAMIDTAALSSPAARRDLDHPWGTAGERVRP